MKKKDCLPIFLAASISLFLFMYLHASFWPAAEAIVKLPMGGAVARFQTWEGLLESQPYVLRVDTPHGTRSAKLWTNWGPADDLALYRTPEDWLVGIGGGGVSIIMDVASKSDPRIITGYEQKATDDRTWEFLGYAQGNAFIPAYERKECIALLGVGYSPYRKNYQSAHFC